MIKLILKHPFVRYALIGGFASVIEYGSFYLLFVTFGMILVLANALSFCFGLTVAFLLNRAWAFGGRQYSKQTTHQFGFYAILAGVNLLLTLVIVGVLKRLGIEPTIGKLIAMIVTSCWNFVLLKFVVFTHTNTLD